MNQPNQYTSAEPGLQPVDLRGSLVKDERLRIANDLHLDSYGQMEPIAQGRQLLSEIEAGLHGRKAFQHGMESSDDLLQEGERVLVDFEDLVLNIAHVTGGAAHLPGLKKRERIQEKINHECQGDANAVTDVVRGSLIFDSLESLYTAIEQVHGTSRIVGIEDRFEHPLSSGYRDLKIHLEIKGADGKSYIAELQFHLKGMHDFKDWETSLYKERRALEAELRQMRAKGDDPTKIRRLEEQVARLQYDAQSVYGKVWGKYTEGIVWN